MLLAKFSSPARALAALAVAAIAAACGSTPGPGPEPNEVKVTAVSPNTGTTFGGTTLTITGTGFQSGAAVQIGGTAATDITVTSATSITAKTPVHAAGVAEVRVTVGSKSGTLASAFTFVKPPTTGPNTAPVVSALAVQPPRLNQPVTLATIGDRISLSASVNDTETAASQLTYEWTATPNVGTFSGTGAAVQWTAPATLTVAQTVALTLTVIDRYQEADANGLPVQREHRVQRSAALKVHNSQKEVTDMAVDFWQLFLTPSITSPPAVLHNFSKACDDGFGYALEHSDIEAHRRDIAEVLSYTITPPTVFEFGYGSRRVCSRKDGSVGDACVEVPVQVRERLSGTNTVRDVQGTGFLTGVYENAQWRLCYSLWTPASTMTGQPVQYDVTPRSAIIKRPWDK